MATKILENEGSREALACYLQSSFSQSRTTPLCSCRAKNTAVNPDPSRFFTSHLSPVSKCSWLYLPNVPQAGPAQLLALWPTIPCLDHCSRGLASLLPTLFPAFRPVTASTAVRLEDGSQITPGLCSRPSRGSPMSLMVNDSTPVVAARPHTTWSPVTPVSWPLPSITHATLPSASLLLLEHARPLLPPGPCTRNLVLGTVSPSLHGWLTRLLHTFTQYVLCGESSWATFFKNAHSRGA